MKIVNNILLFITLPVTIIVGLLAFMAKELMELEDACFNDERDY
jgi:hypothetical protein